MIVPVEVKAYLVNQTTSLREAGYGHWELDFTDPNDLGRPPEPYPNVNQVTAPDPGTYVHWSLPRALRTPQGTDADSFPVVPNRWLVVRSSQTGAWNSDPSFKAWVVESDNLIDPDVPGFDSDALDAPPWKENHCSYPFTVQTPYTDDYGDQYNQGDVKEGIIGRPFAVEGWSEDNSDALFLTALGPGHLAFCGFQPYHKGVFSFYDDLDGVSDNSTLDYLVVGWYSDPTKDILAGASDLGALLEQLGWGAGRSTTDALSVYAGTALRLPWTETGDLPAGTVDNLPDSAKQVDLAVGHDTSEAAAADRVSGNYSVSRLLQAFLSDRMSVLDQNPQEFDDTVHSSWFAPQKTDYAWMITDSPGCDTATTDTELENERNWLAALNAKQYQYNLLARNETGLQDRLYNVWRFGQMPDQAHNTPWGKPAGFDPTAEINALAASLKSVQDQMAALLTGTDGIPSGATEEAFQASLLAFEKAHGLDPNCENENGVHRVLTRVPLPPFYTPNDPVALLDGVNADKVPEYPDLLRCRSRDQLVAQMKINGSLQSPPSSVPGWSSRLPGQVQDAFNGLFQEFALLARAAGHGSTSQDNDLVTDLGTLDKQTGVSDSFKDSGGQDTGPGYFSAAWNQPWEPVYLVWRIDYFPVPMDTTTGYHWAFDANSGRYQLAKEGTPGTVQPLTYYGRAALTDLPSDLAKSAVERHFRLYDNVPEALKELPSQMGPGPISQMMDGFLQNLEQRMSGAGVEPNPHDPSDNTDSGHLSDLLADYDYPDSGFPVPDPDHMHLPGIRFTPAGGGQFVFTFVDVVDSMGRDLPCINPGHGNALEPSAQKTWIADTLKPSVDPGSGQPILVNAEYGPEPIYVQVGPRIAEPSRLRFDFVSANTSPSVSGAVVNDPPVVATASHPAPSPVVGWLLVNQLTGSLLVHDADGAQIMEGRKGIGTDGSTESEAIDWATLPYYPYQDDPTDSTGDFAKACPELFGFLTGLRNGKTAAFDSLVGAIGDSSLTAPPVGNSSSMVAPLVGTPVALLRARLTLESATLAITDPSWGSTQPPYPVLDFPTPDYLKNAWNWNIRLGGQHRNGNGVMETTDGLIGYFTHATSNGRVQTDKPTDYGVFRTADGQDSGYAQKITAQDLALPVNLAPMPENPNKHATDPSDPVVAYVTMVVHPWAEINAVTDILPTVTLRLPEEDVRTPLSRLQIPCRMGPILAGTRPVPTSAGENDEVTAVVMPRPENWTGTWDWSEVHPSGGGGKEAALAWDHYPLTPPDTLAHFDQESPVARTGYLTLAAALGEAPPTGEGDQHTPRNAKQPADAPTTETHPEHES
ncbi:hypothetical protein ACIBKX_32665 [Streptomyces sp. NPDC050658]|uniref:hypothetical protein n=1 Tax=unclassified Streptomyces TaxID=2593676 RepID=UPI00341A3A0B